MILTLHDHTQRITVGHVDPETAVRLAASLPHSVRLSVRPDELAPSVHDPGYFGLAVAITRQTWAPDEQYQAYLRGELSDPRD